MDDKTMKKIFDGILNLANQVNQIEDEVQRIVVIQQITWGKDWRSYTPENILKEYDGKTH